MIAKFKHYGSIFWYVLFGALLISVFAIASRVQIDPDENLVGIDPSNNTVTVTGVGSTTLNERTAVIDAQAGGSTTTTETGKFRFDHVSIRLTTSQTPIVTIRLDKTIGAGFDTIIDRRTMTGLNYVFIPDSLMKFISGDQIRVEVDTAGGACTANVAIVTEEIN